MGVEVLYLRDLVNVNKFEFLDYSHRCVALDIPVCEDADFIVNGRNQIGVGLERVTDIEVTLPSFVNFVYHGSKYIEFLNLNNVTVIKEDGLSHSSALTKVCGKKLLTCRNKSFYACLKLKEIDFPRLKTVGFSVFTGCFSLQNVDLPNLLSIENYAFENTCIYSFKGKKVKSIGDGAFQFTPLMFLDVPNCYELHNVCKQGNKKVFLRVRQDCIISVHRGTDYYSLSEYEKYAESHQGMSCSQIRSVLSKYTDSVKLS
jgi:hypothetical protein